MLGTKIYPLLGNNRSEFQATDNWSLEFMVARGMIGYYLATINA